MNKRKPEILLHYGWEWEVGKCMIATLEHCNFLTEIESVKQHTSQFISFNTEECNKIM